MPCILFYCLYLIFFEHTSTFQSSGQVVVTGVVPSPPRFLPSISIAEASAIPQLIDVPSLLTHALALSASQLVHKESPHEFIRLDYALGEIRTHETGLPGIYQARGQPDAPPGRPASIVTAV